MKWFIKNKNMVIRIHGSLIQIGLGLSYTPMESHDKKLFFRFKRGITLLDKKDNYFRIKLFLIDILFIYISKRELRKIKMRNKWM